MNTIQYFILYINVYIALFLLWHSTNSSLPQYTYVLPRISASGII